VNRTKRPLAALMIALACIVSFDEGLAQVSSINTGIPNAEKPFQALPIQQNFQAAASDINNIIGMHAATSTASCPASPVVGEDCLVLGPPITWFKWQSAGWQIIGTFSPTFSPAVGGSANLNPGQAFGNPTGGAAPAQATFLDQLFFGSGAIQFQILPRSTNGFPVAVTRPTTPNTRIFADLLPKGTGVVNSEGFITRHDDCDLDLIATPSGAVGCAFFGVDVTAGYAVFGSLSYNGGTLRPLCFAYGIISDVVNCVGIFTGTKWQFAGVQDTAFSVAGVVCNDASGNFSTTATGCAGFIQSVAGGGTGATAPGATAANNIGALAEANNLSDLQSAGTARTNLGVTATGSDTTYNYRANNLSDVANAGTARTNLGVAIGSNVEAWAANLDTYAGKSPPAGTVIGTSDAQTLTNKTFDTATNTFKLNGVQVTTPSDMRTQTEQGRTLLAVFTVSSSTASISDCPTGCNAASFSSAFNDVELVVDNCTPVTNSVDLLLQIHSGGVFQSSGYNASGTPASLTNGAATISNVAGTGLSGVLYIHNVNSTSVYKLIVGPRIGWMTSATADNSASVANGWFGGQGVVDGWQLAMSGSSNIAACVVKEYGLRNAL
jgi:hypothetical protein